MARTARIQSNTGVYHVILEDKEWYSYCSPDEFEQYPNY